MATTIILNHDEDKNKINALAIASLWEDILTNEQREGILNYIRSNYTQEYVFPCWKTQENMSDFKANHIEIFSSI